MTRNATETKAGLPILGFADLADWLAWLAAQPADAKGAWVKLAKGKTKGLAKAEAVDGALCHGWIDGQIDRYDDAFFLTRFTPRKPRSKWSEKNRKRTDDLIAAGRMTPEGQAEIDAAKADGRWDAAYAPPSSIKVPADFAAALAAEPAARAFFDTLTGANRYTILYRIDDAKKPETRVARIARFVAMCAAGETIHGSAKPGK